MPRCHDHRQLDCLLSSLFKRTIKKTLKIHITGPPWELFTSDKDSTHKIDSNAEMDSMLWRLHEWRHLTRN